MLDDKKQEQAEAAKADEAFDSGFAGETTAMSDASPPAKPATAEATTGDTAQPAKPATEAKPSAKPAKAEPAAKPIQTKPDDATVAKPEYVRLTRADYDDLKATVAQLPGMKQQIEKAFGTLGNLQQFVTKLQKETPAGRQVEIPKGVTDKLRKEFPEIAGHLDEILTQVLHGVSGTASAADVDFDARDKKLREEMGTELRADLKKARQEEEAQYLSELFPDWRDIVGGVDAEGRHDPKHPFRTWLAKQPEDYQRRVNTSDSAMYLAEVIRKYKRETAKPQTNGKPAPKVLTRKARIAAAVQPKGVAGPVIRTKTDDDQFNEGFAEG